MKTLKNNLTAEKLMAVLSVLLIAVSCDVSSLSDKEVTEVSGIKAFITIWQSPYNENMNGISVRLLDQDNKKIGNENIKLRVNDQELSLSIRQELYYTKSIKYIGSNIPVTDSYYLEIQLTNDSIAPLAFIKATPSITKESMILPKEGNLNSPTKIAWENMKAFDNIRIWKTYKLHGETAYGGGKYATSTIKRKIDQNGDFTVGQSFYTDSVSTISTLNVDFYLSKEGLINPNLLAGSINLNAVANKKIRFELEE